MISVALGCARGFNKEELIQFMTACLVPTASILLVIGACSAFKIVLITSGVDEGVAAYDPCR
ncbi:hypothetical protein [Bacillus sp. BA3]|uniref:GntT/GntP/DsdX family permease n=1 Tax=Bacillaceae TaxID=186817 RepID=UPI000C338C19|nr:hypothetical protein CW306_13665 [Bacillus sp. BA3]